MSKNRQDPFTSSSTRSCSGCEHPKLKSKLSRFGVLSLFAPPAHPQSVLRCFFFFHPLNELKPTESERRDPQVHAWGAARAGSALLRRSVLKKRLWHRSDLLHTSGDSYTESPPSTSTKSCFSKTTTGSWKTHILCYSTCACVWVNLGYSSAAARSARSLRTGTARHTARKPPDPTPLNTGPIPRTETRESTRGRREGSLW